MNARIRDDGGNANATVTLVEGRGSSPPLCSILHNISTTTPLGKEEKSDQAGSRAPGPEEGVTKPTERL